MLLPKRFAFAPILLLIGICAAFFVSQRHGVDLIQMNYNLCHALFGFAAPLFFSYWTIPARRQDLVPLRVFLRQIAATPIPQWPMAVVRSMRRDIDQGTPWSPLMGAMWTLLFSMRNEMVIDPEENDIPFFSAYEHFVADLCGIVLFLLLASATLKKLNGLDLQSAATSCAPGRSKN